VLRHFSHWPCRIGSVGTRAPDKGVSGARRGLRNEGVVQEGGRGEGNKREGESCWKSGGGRVRLYTWRRTGLADEVRCDAIPDAAGGEGRSRGR
jgi:hypothetical protein